MEKPPFKVSCIFLAELATLCSCCLQWVPSIPGPWDRASHFSWKRFPFHHASQSYAKALLKPPLTWYLCWSPKAAVKKQNKQTKTPPQTEWFSITEMYPCIVLEARSPRSKCLQCWFKLEVLRESFPHLSPRSWWLPAILGLPLHMVSWLSGFSVLNSEFLANGNKSGSEPSLPNDTAGPICRSQVWSWVVSSRTLTEDGTKRPSLPLVFSSRPLFLRATAFVGFKAGLGSLSLLSAPRSSPGSSCLFLFFDFAFVTSSPLSNKVHQLSCLKGKGTASHHKRSVPPPMAFHEGY